MEKELDRRWIIWSALLLVGNSAVLYAAVKLRGVYEDTLELAAARGELVADQSREMAAQRAQAPQDAASG